ncbi:MAG: carbohydrate ABC transporter permease [Lachnoanaerobaculum sp.]|jgi:sugar ABC superfamily ATP binding cassette transporter, membrane protein|uniref:carbohydrate ABC transporter permease n=1 Tax=Lachnoanaerobaculum TaxID=1164882 RepID=UPI000F2B1D2B|nr:MULTISPECIES: carbohydrate ABC transporter permease [unclassified Lachnoanaerobaculum]MBS5882136.1 carbohydrate ABC transporter permease [Lachnoanaerobaculum sp.]MDU6630121.1 carbohydrate ABC transporter permease [Lachnoanaerobaculum sp.]RKW44080.1 MAG: carbohydrate ABC transporter permease [Lachnospiraceae bacterium]GMO03022.1 carbohydrate ABC transporter permease [Lachnoanaerobaculum sp. JCM 36186]
MNNKKINKVLGNVIFYLGNIIVGLIFVSPLLWMLASSFKPELEIFSNLNSLSTFIPKNFTLANYAEVFQRIKVFTILKNTLIYIGIVLIGDLLLGSMFGYALAKMKYRFRGISLTIVIALMSMPVEAIILPLYIEMAQLNWVNTMLGLTIPFMMNCFSIYMFYSYFIGIPDELIEAAKVDGCGPIRTYFKIIMPISKTVFATVLILDFVSRWNDFMWPFLITTGEEKRTVQLAVQIFVGVSPIHYGVIMAVLTLASIPMILMYIFMQKFYVEGIASTGIKG